MTIMKAIQLNDYGGPELLRYDEAPRPAPGEGQLLVRVFAAGVNPVDWKTRAGFLKGMVPLTFPWTPGGDFSGVVEELGANVSDLQTGAEVFGKIDLPRNGSYAEYVVVPRASVAAKPRKLDHVHAAAVPLAALTAYQALFGNDAAPSLELHKGQTLLILGAAGGVGSFALQLAKAKGANVVALGRPSQEAHLLELDADKVIDSEHFDDAGEVDAVLDLLGGVLQQQAWRHLKQGGALASTMGPPPEAEANQRGARAISVFTQTNGQQLEALAKLIDAGKVKVVVSKTFPLAAAAQAHELLEHGSVYGKVVLTVAPGV